MRKSGSRLNHCASPESEMPKRKTIFRPPVSVHATLSVDSGLGRRVWGFGFRGVGFRVRTFKPPLSTPTDLRKTLLNLLDFKKPMLKPWRRSKLMQILTFENPPPRIVPEPSVLLQQLREGAWKE